MSKPKPRRLHPLIVWLRTGGLAAQLFGWGALMLAGLFWLAVILIYAGFALLVIDVWLEPGLEGHIKSRVGITVLIVVLVSAFSWGIVFVKAPLEVAAFTTDAEYPIGTKVANIEWRPQFTELEIWITNSSERNYEDMELLIRPTVPVAAIGQITNVPNVSFDDKNGTAFHLIDIDLTSGLKSGIPLTLLATDAGYKVRCQHLSAKTTVKVAMALADIKWGAYPKPDLPVNELVRDPNYVVRLKADDFSSYWEGHPDGDVYTSRPKSADWLKIEGKYEAAQRTRLVSEKILVGGNLTMTHWR